MNFKEIQEQIQELQRQMEGISSAIADLKEQTDNMTEDDVPGMLEFDKCETGFIVNGLGIIEGVHGDKFRSVNRAHRLFKSREMAELFAKKTQFIAECLFWKELYDKDYVPDLKDSNSKYAVVFDHYTNCYKVASYIFSDFGIVYFSSEEIAVKCAYWMNSRLYGNEEDVEYES